MNFRRVKHLKSDTLNNTNFKLSRANGKILRLTKEQSSTCVDIFRSKNRNLSFQCVQKPFHASEEVLGKVQECEESFKCQILQAILYNYQIQFHD